MEEYELKGDIYLPGDFLREGKVPPGKELVVYEKDGRLYAAVPLMMDEAGNIISLEAVYKSKVGDPIVGVVVDTRGPNYVVDIGVGANCMILSKMEKVKLRKGDVVFGRIVRLEYPNTVILGNVVKLIGNGVVVDVPPAKVPRIIGKKSSMLRLLKEGLNVKMFVGANGYIWIDGEGDNVVEAVRIIKFIVIASHLGGLTERVQRMIESFKKS